MKALKFFLLASLLIAGTFISKVTVAQTKKLVLQNTPSGTLNFGYITDNITTTNGSAKNADTVTLGSDEAGVLRVTVVGFNKDSAAAVTGVKLYRYVKSGGTLTLSSATNDLAVSTDAKLGSSTFAVASVANNAVVQVTGTASVTIHWKILIQRTFVQLE